MKVIFAVVLSAVLMCGCAEGMDNDTEQLYDALPPQAYQIIDGIDMSGGAESFQDGAAAMVKYASAELVSLVKNSVKSIFALLFVVILCNVADGMYCGGKSEKVPKIAALSGTLAIVMLSSGSISDLIGLGCSTIDEMSQFSKVLLPTLAMASAAAGSVSSAAVREIITVFFADFLITCIDQIVVPMIYLYLGAITAGAVIKNPGLTKLADVIKKITVWLLTILVSAFTGYLTLSGALASSADNLAVKAAEFALSGGVPVVGGILSDAAGSVLAGAAVLRSTIGAIGTLGIFAICIIPFLKLGIQYLLYKLTAFLAMTIDSTSLASLIDKLGGAFGIVLGMSGATAFLLIISIISSVTAVTYG